ncbi:hypothetical protein [Flavobacterium sp.]|uniref:hypothetical protein n=1 Tax=Flavobacterium sp. TaxID=239 RepID=UPI0039195D30
MKKYHFILIVLLGIFLMPDNAIACGSGKEKKSCKKEMSAAKSCKKSCCGSDDSKDKDNKGCEGNCGHSKCGCSSTCPPSSVSFLSEINFKVTMFNYSSIGKVKFLYATPSISDGFYSIWLIPKIS